MNNYKKLFGTEYDYRNVELIMGWALIDKCEKCIFAGTDRCRNGENPEVCKEGMTEWFHAEYIEPPDTWERLLDDLDHAWSVCSYFGTTKCSNCRIGEPAIREGFYDTGHCLSSMISDIATRIQALRGDLE